MAKQPAQEQQLSFAEMMAQLTALKKNMEGQAEARLEEINEELKTLSEVTGKSIAEMLGINTARPAPVAAPRATSSRAPKGNRDPRIDTIKEKFKGMFIINPVSGKPYEIGSRGAFPAFILERFDDIMNGKIDVLSKEDMANKGNEEPEEQPDEEQPEA